MVSNRATLLIFVLVLGYAAVALSPLKDEIGRRSPQWASAFDPPFFNFANEYEQGSVMGFQVGMSKPALFAALTENYADRADLTVDCRVATANSLIKIAPETDIAAVYGGGPRLCVRLDSRRLAADFHFREDVVSRIGVRYIRSESI
jgi:hypothetical protein